MTPDSPSLLIAGASVRAAAASALRAGLRPWCLDLFGDADLVRACPVQVMSLGEYPQAIPELLSQGPPGPWMYTGAIENHPALLQSGSRPLWGNAASVVESVRTPGWLRFCLGGAFTFPRCLPEDGDTDPAARWLLKPRRGAGGLGIQEWARDRPFDATRYYLQERIDGEPCSAVFLGAGKSREQAQEKGPDTFLIGVTRQLLGTPWLNVPGSFQYAGSVGPWPIATTTRDQLSFLAGLLSNCFDLRGLFGIDFMLRGDEVWPVEVNPRYTASVEILERATRSPILAEHAAVFTGRAARGIASPGPGFHGKAILYAKEDLIVPDRGPWLDALDFDLADLDVPYADLPHPGQHITRGQPILTVFARADTIAACEDALKARVAFPFA